MPILATLLLTAAASTPPPVPFPARPGDALNGTDFAARVAALSDQDRYAATRDQVLAGNVPSYLRTLVPVRMSEAGPGVPEVIVFVLPDYLSVGTDDDCLPVPLDFVAAAEVARALGLALPTRRIVDAVYLEASLHLAPVPLPAGPEMRSVSHLLEHRARIEQERTEPERGELVAGTKKDLVLTPLLLHNQGKEAIYGWHRLDGHPIQPLSLVHGEHYADYSHGIRFVSSTVLVDGLPCSYFDVLADPALAHFLSDEGPIAGAQALLDAAANAGG